MDKTVALAEMAAISGMTRQALILFGLMAAGLILRFLARRRARQREGRLDGLMRPTLAARLARPLPAEAALIAGIGTGGAARQSLDSQVLRPSPGLKMLVVIVVGLMLVWWLGGGLAFTGVEGLVPERAPVMEGLVIAAGLWSLVWVLTWELRWNRDEIVLTRLVFFRRARRWRDLTGVLDSRHHDYVLTFADGSRLRVLKNLTGIDGFLEQVTMRLRPKGDDPRMGGRR